MHVPRPLSVLLLIPVLLAGSVLTASPAGSAIQGGISATAAERSGPNLSRRVVLTYDDCPRDLSGYLAVLRYARSANVGLVIAPTGHCVTRFRHFYGVDIARLARQHSQYVINHSVSHPDLRTLSCAGVVRELKAPGVVTNFGRPPYGAVNNNVRCGYAAVGMRIWQWHLDTADYLGKSRSQVVDYVGRNTLKGQTVLMHLQWNGFSPSAIRQMRYRLKLRGIELCRAYRGADNRGALRTAPVLLPQRLSC